jgi:hypothetical protein
MEVEFELKQGINHVFIPVYVNDKGPYRFTLDTGAQATTISSELTKELGLETTELEGEKFKPLKEKRNLKKTEAKLRIGEEELVTDEVWTMDLGMSVKTDGKNIVKKVVKEGEKSSPQAHPNLEKMIKKTESGDRIMKPIQGGVIGFTTLKNYLLSVDYGSKKLKLKDRSSNFINENLDKMKGFEYIGDTHLVGVPVQINDNEPLLFVADTGAGGTTISKKLYERLDLPLNDMVVKVVGIYGAQETRIAIIDELIVSSNIYNNINAVIMDESLAGPRGKIIENGILGYSVFKDRELIIDYLNQTFAIV